MKPKELLELEKINKEIHGLVEKAGELSKLPNVKKYIFEEHSKEAYDFVEQELKKGNIVWCRNGSVIGLATLCRGLSCEYKADRFDIVNGCSKCHNFQVTESSAEWGGAKHINAEWMLNLPVGW